MAKLLKCHFLQIVVGALRVEEKNFPPKKKIKIPQNAFSKSIKVLDAERSGSVGSALDLGLRVASSNLTACLVLVQPMKTHPNMPERLLTGM